MKFKYTPEQLSKVIEHEEHMLIVYNQLLEKYKDAFAKYQCSLKVEMHWYDRHLKQASNHRIPLKHGYMCYVIIGAQKDGKFIKIESDDGEVEWYGLWTSSLEITEISWTLLCRKITLYSGTDDVEEELQDFLELLEKNPGKIM